MEIANYDRSTGAFIGIGVASINPVNAEMPLIPAYATPHPAPAVQAGQVAVYIDLDGVSPMNWEDGDWQIVADYRDAALYSVPSGEPFELGSGNGYTGVGALPADVTDVPRPSPAHVWSEGAWALDDALAAKLRTDAARQKRQAESNRARAAIEPLQMAVDIGEQTEAELIALLAWKRYFVALGRIDVAADPIVWPDGPAT